MLPEMASPQTGAPPGMQNGRPHGGRPEDAPSSNTNSHSVQGSTVEVAKDKVGRSGEANMAKNVVKKVDKVKVDRLTDVDGAGPASCGWGGDGMSESPLRRELEAAMTEHGMSMKDLTVMSDQTDPFRLDTPAHHRDGKWLADVMATQGLAPRPLIDSRWSWLEQTRRLKASRSYQTGGAS